jgi:hypothetical protein
VRSSAFYFSFQYVLVSLRSSSSCLPLLPRLPLRLPWRVWHVKCLFSHVHVLALSFATVSAKLMRLMLTNYMESVLSTHRFSVSQLPVFMQPEGFLPSLRIPSLSPPLESQSNLAHLFPSYFFNAHFNIIFTSLPRSAKLSRFIMISHQDSLCTSILRHTCLMSLPFHLFLFDRPDIF